MDTKVIATESYKGHELVVTYYGGSASRYERYELTVDGKGFYGFAKNASEGEAKATKALIAKGRSTVDTWEEDARLTPALIPLATTDAGPINPGDGFAQVGEVVKLYSRGTTRLGICTKITKTGTATVAYVTPGGIDEAARHQAAGYGDGLPTVTRKAAKLGEYEIVVAHTTEELRELDAQEEAPEAPAGADLDLCTHEGEERHERTAHGYLGDAPRGTVQTLCAGCGTVLASTPPPPPARSYTDGDLRLAKGDVAVARGLAAERAHAEAHEAAQTPRPAAERSVLDALHAEVAELDDDELVAGSGDPCPACGNVIDFCQGHGPIGDPAGHAALVAAGWVELDDEAAPGREAYAAGQAAVAQALDRAAERGAGLPSGGGRGV